MSELISKPPEIRFPDLKIGSLNQVINGMSRVTTGDGVQLKKFGDRFIIENRPEFIRDDPNIRNVVVVGEEDDYLVCVFFDFSNQMQAYDEELGITLQDLGLTAVPILVAKPYWLQVTPFAGTVFAHDGSAITPPYVVGDVLVAWRSPTSLIVLDIPVVWSDLNTAGRNRGVSSGGSGSSFLGRSIGIIPGRSVSISEIASLTDSFNIGEETVPASYTGQMPLNKLFNAVIDSEEMSFFYNGETVQAICRGVNGTTEANHNALAVIKRKRITNGIGNVAILKSEDGDSVDTCKTVSVENPCGAISNRALVQVWPEGESGKLMVTVLCVEAADPPIPPEEQPVCGFCTTVNQTYTISFPGVTEENASCEEFCLGLQTTYTLTKQGGFCEWAEWRYNCNSDGYNLTYMHLGPNPDNLEETLLFVDMLFNGAIIASYSIPAADWNCEDDVVLTKRFPTGTDPDYLGICNNWPSTITVSKLPPELPTTPTVDFNDDNIYVNATTTIITGTGFETGTPSNNEVTFNLGMAGTVTAATSTQLTVTIYDPPDSLGALTAVVTNTNGSSGLPVQVGTVIDPPDEPGTDCETAPEFPLGQGFGDYQQSPGGGSLWFKFPSGLSAGTYKANVNVISIPGGSLTVRLWIGADCDNLVQGSSSAIFTSGITCVDETLATNMWLEVDPASVTGGDVFFEIDLASGAC